MKTLLDTLYKEYEDLQTKMQKLAELIIAYGGDAPSGGNKAVFPRRFIPQSVETPAYPMGGTWRDKVLYILGEAYEPLTANQVGQLMKEQGEEKDLTHIQNMATQYCSTLYKEEKVAVENDKTIPYKYALKSE